MTSPHQVAHLFVQQHSYEAISAPEQHSSQAAGKYGMPLSTPVGQLVDATGIDVNHSRGSVNTPDVSDYLEMKLVICGRMYTEGM